MPRGFIERGAARSAAPSYVGGDEAGDDDENDEYVGARRRSESDLYAKADVTLVIRGVGTQPVAISPPTDNGASAVAHPNPRSDGALSQACFETGMAVGHDGMSAYTQSQRPRNGRHFGGAALPHT